MAEVYGVWFCECVRVGSVCMSVTSDEWNVRACVCVVCELQDAETGSPSRGQHTLCWSKSIRFQASASSSMDEITVVGEFLKMEER